MLHWNMQDIPKIAHYYTVRLYFAPTAEIFGGLRMLYEVARSYKGLFKY